MSDGLELDLRLDRGWLGLEWSAWMPLVAAHPLALQQLPEAPGIFRIRTEREWAFVAVQPAEHGVRLEVDRLARQIRLAARPASSHELANRLWREYRSRATGFQVSGARAGAGMLIP